MGPKLWQALELYPELRRFKGWSVTTPARELIWSLLQPSRSCRGWKSRLKESSQRELNMEPSIPEDEDFLPPTVPSLEKTEEVWRLDP